MVAAEASSFFRKLFACSCADDDGPFEVAGGLSSSLTKYNHSSSGVRDAAAAAAAEDGGGFGLPPLRCGNPGAYLPIMSLAGDGSSGVLAAMMAREFEHKELSKATGRFHRRALVGEGAAGAVFRGTVQGHDGLQAPVAVKRFHAAIGKEDVEHVRGDLEGQPLRHRNLVYIIGYCLKERKLYLVYDLMENGNLEKHLFTTERQSHPSLSWPRRFNIVRGVALGLQHLHSNGSIHGSVKARNVFLEEGDLTPRLGDFGYSRLEPSPSMANDVYRPLPEAAGCLVPSCSARAGATREADVFYFGVLVVEVVCGRRRLSSVVTGPGGFGLQMVDWVWSLHGEGRILDAVDASFLGAADADGGSAGLDRAQAERLLLVGLACSHPDPEERPDMDAVVEVLESDSAPPPVVPPSKPQYVPPEHHHAGKAAAGGRPPNRSMQGRACALTGNLISNLVRI